MRRSRLQSNLYIGGLLCGGKMYLHEENSGRKHKNANRIWLADAHLGLSSLPWLLSSAPLTITAIVGAHLAARNRSPIKRGLWENSGTSEGHLRLKNRDFFCAVHSILLNKSSGWHNKNMSPSWPRGGRGGFCLRTIPAPLLFSQAVHIPSPSLSPPLPFLSLHFYLFFFWKGAVKTGSCYVAVAGLVFTM